MAILRGPYRLTGANAHTAQCFKEYCRMHACSMARTFPNKHFGFFGTAPEKLASPKLIKRYINQRSNGWKFCIGREGGG